MAGVGSLMQLAATGPQNAYLDTDPQVDYWETAWQHYTPFATAVQELEFPTGLDFGADSMVVVPKAAHMLGEMYLECTLPALGIDGCWVDGVGFAMLQDVKLTFNDQLVHQYDPAWADVHARVHQPHGRRQALQEMVGSGRVLDLQTEHRLYVPLDFFFSQHGRGKPRLPLVAMSNTEVTVSLSLRSLADLVVTPNVADDVPPVSLVDPKLLLNYTWLDAPEVAAILAAPELQMLVQQERSSVTYNYALDSGSMDMRVLPVVTVPLNFLNNCVEQLLWVVQLEEGASGLQYLEAVDAATLLFSGAERFSGRPGKYFELCNPRDYCTSWAPGVYSYSFALDASMQQPSGTANFSAMEDCSLRLQLNSTERCMIRTFGLSYNTLLISNGQARLAFE